jgi:hypothetical protein
MDQQTARDEFNLKQTQLTEDRIDRQRQYELQVDSLALQRQQMQLSQQRLTEQLSAAKDDRAAQALQTATMMALLQTLAPK